MSSVLNSTDQACRSVVDELQRRLPDAPLKELPQTRDLWNCFADRNLGEWTPVGSDLDDADCRSTDSTASEAPAVWTLERRTQYREQVQVRGFLRFVIAQANDRLANEATQQARRIAEQIASVGEVQQVLLARDPDTEVPFGAAMHLAVLVQVASHYEDEITRDERGVVWLKDTQIKVREVVLYSLCHGWSVLRIFHQYGGSIPISRIHAAFTYFDNYRSEILREIEAAERYAADSRAKHGQPPALRQLLARQA